jgi:hypothetical protein
VPSFQRCLTRRSVGLRDSGEVAPSAPSPLAARLALPSSVDGNRNLARFYAGEVRCSSNQATPALATASTGGEAGGVRRYQNDVLMAARRCDKYASEVWTSEWIRWVALAISVIVACG